MNRDNFKWTDELAEKYCNIYKYSTPDNLSDFKASHSIGNEEWEIVERGSSETGRHFETPSCAFSGCEIYSVRRKSDGVVFTVGDMIESCTGLTDPWKIENIKIINEKYIYLDACPLRNAILKPLPQRTKLFTTEDGVDVFGGDTVFGVAIQATGGELIRSSTLPFPPFRVKLNRVWFKSELAAKEYIIENKACLSAKDAIELWGKDCYLPRAIRNLVRNKLKL